MKNNVLITVLSGMMILLLFTGISAGEAYGQGYPAPGYNPGVQGTSVYNQQNAYTTPCNEACQSGNCRIVSNQSYYSNGVPRKIQVLIPVTELVNDIQRIKQTIVTPVCDQTIVTRQPYSTLASGTEETTQSKECVDNGNGNCVPAIPGIPPRPIQVNGTTVVGQANTQTSNKCRSEVTVTVQPQTIQRNATAYKIVCFTWMDYMKTEVVQKTCTGTPQVTQEILPPRCIYCTPQNYGAISSSYQAPCQTSQYQKEYQYGSSFEGGFKPSIVRLGKGPVLGNKFGYGY